MPKKYINNISLNYEIYGQGEPLILISGFSADHTVWFPVIDEFSKKYQVIVLDNRGSGQSDSPSQSYSVEQMAEDVIGLCDALGIASAHFIGNSMGGFIVQTLSHLFPARVKSIVLCNTATSAQVSGFYFYPEARLKLMKENASKEALAQIDLCWCFSPQFLLQNDRLSELLSMIGSNPFPMSIAGYEGQIAALKNFDSSGWIQNITARTLIISGDQDLIFSTAVS